MKVYYNTSPDKRLSVFIAAVVFCIFLSNLVAGLQQFFGLNASIVSAIFKLFLGIMFILRVNIFVNRLNKNIVLFVLLSLNIVLFSYLFFPENNHFFVNTVVSFYSFCLTTYIVAYTIKDYDLLIVELTKVSYLIAIIVLLFTLGVFSGVVGPFNEGKYSMGLGYSCIIPAIIVSLDIIKYKKKANIIFIGVFIIAIISFGSRGPLIELVLFLLYFAIRFFVKNKMYFKTILLILSYLFLLLNYKNILTLISVVLTSIGIRSRVIKTLTTDSIYLSGRDELYRQLIPDIKDSPFLIRGINAEWNVLGVYAHNIIIELLYQLGIIIGGIIVIYIIIRIFQTLTIRNMDSKGILCIVFMFSCIPQLFVSGSVWTNYIFWIWMAMCNKCFSNTTYWHLERKQKLDLTRYKRS